MSAIISGNNKEPVPLKGRIRINGSKNATLPIMAACLLTSEPVILGNIPNITDVTSMTICLRDLGAKVELILNPTYPGNHSLYIDTSNVQSWKVNSLLASKFRASFTLLGPLLARFGHARLPLPGGCQIGLRSVDRHILALEKIGVIFCNSVHGNVEGHVPELGWKEGVVRFQEISVGATENLIMASVLGQKGRVTQIKNSATEPDVQDLAKFLVRLGAKISGIGTRTMTVTAVEMLHGCRYTVSPDCLEAATYALATIMTNGKLKLFGGLRKSHFQHVQQALDAIGGILLQKRDHLVVYANHKINKSKTETEIPFFAIQTAPYPGFPTDLQPGFCTAFTQTKLNSVQIIEKIYDNRFHHCIELCKLGANINWITNEEILIHSCTRLVGREVMAHDLRGASALVLAGLVASGETRIHGIHHLLRGYEAMDLKLRNCGAKIQIE